MNNKYKEIEIKHPLKNSKIVIDRLHELGAKKLLSHQIQEDIYYIPSHRNFLDEKIVSEWLRIRETQNETTLNYKRWLPLGAEIQTHADEFETKISDITAIKNILKYLDFKEIVTVHKDRSTWLLNNVEIAIDEVNNLGSFIELEIKNISFDNVEDAHKHLNKTLEQLNAETLPRDRRGYPFQLLNLK